MKIKLSALLSDMRGTLNGSYISRDISGLVLRNRAGSTRMPSASQVRNRIAFQYISNRWNSISEGCRQQWREKANENPYTNEFGNIQNLSGIAYFIKINMTNLYAGDPLLDCPETELVIFEPLPWEIMPPSKKDLRIYAKIPTNYPYRFAIYARPLHNIGSVSHNTNYSLISVVAENDFVENEVNILPAFEKHFGKLEMGRGISIMLRQISKSGKISLPTFNSNIIGMTLPVIKDFSVRVSVDGQTAYMSAIVLNQESLQDGQVKLYISLTTNHNYCPVDLLPYIEDGPEYNALLAGQEFVIPGFYPNIECGHVGIQYSIAGQNEDFTLASTFVNILDLPMQE